MCIKCAYESSRAPQECDKEMPFFFKENKSRLGIIKKYLSRGSGLLSLFGFAGLLLVFFYKLASPAKHCE